MDSRFTLPPACRIDGIGPVSESQNPQYPRYRSPLLEIVVENPKESLKEEEDQKILQRLCLFITGKIKKMLPALISQWTTYDVKRGSTIAWKNEEALCCLINESRFLAAVCISILLRQACLFPYLGRPELNDYSRARVPEFRMVPSLDLNEGLFFFLYKQSQEILYLAISKGSKFSLETWKLDKKELSRLLQKRRASKKCPEASSYPDDYAAQVKDCKAAYVAWEEMIAAFYASPN
jgi:hypothetical protein